MQYSPSVLTHDLFSSATVSLSIINQILTERDFNTDSIIQKSIQLSNWPGSVGARREVTWCVRALPPLSIAHYSFFKYWLLLSLAMCLANLLVSVKSRVPLN